MAQDDSGDFVDAVDGTVGGRIGAAVHVSVGPEV